MGKHLVMVNSIWQSVCIFKIKHSVGAHCILCTAHYSNKMLLDVGILNIYNLASCGAVTIFYLPPASKGCGWEIIKRLPYVQASVSPSIRQVFHKP